MRKINVCIEVCVGFPSGSVVKNLYTNAGEAGSTLGSGRSSAGGNGNLFQYSFLGNSMDRGPGGLQPIKL